MNDDDGGGVDGGDDDWIAIMIQYLYYVYIDGLVQDCSISGALDTADLH